jgi:hypothetical protein
MKPCCLFVNIERIFDLAKLRQGGRKRRLIIPHLCQLRLHAKGSIQFFDTLLIFPLLYKTAPELGPRIGQIGSICKA